MFTPASVDPELARFVAERGSNGRLTRFTPAGVAARSSRTVTVAVRVGEDEARAIGVRSALQSAREQVAGDPGLRITPTRFDLGVSRDYQSFAKPTRSAAGSGTGAVAGRSGLTSRSLSDAGIPNLADFRPSETAEGESGRFAARIALDEQAKPGAAPRTLDSRSDQALDVAGSYRLTRNLDVTAGVRYTQERDRLAPMAQRTEQDSQAVYIGTQFRF